MKKFEFIMEDIKKQIKSGKLVEGDRLPSIATSATLYDCSKGTVQRAYQQLIAEHFLYVKNQSGFFVAKPFHLSGAPETVYNLTTGNTLINEFPLKEAQTSLVQALDNYQYQSLDLSYKGIPSLIKTLQKHLTNKKLFVHEDEIFINEGIHQAFVDIVSSFLKKDKYVLIENPTYSYTNQFLKEKKIPTKWINRTDEGISMTELEAFFKTGDIQFFYLVPRANNPLGTNLNKKTIRQIARLAEKYQVIIIENDYFLEGQPAPLQETILENARENCIYLSSFSKIMPILRIGYMIVPRNLILGMNQVKQRIYMEGQYPPAMISQAFLEIILKNNLLARYNHTLSTDIKEKKELIHQVSAPWQKQYVQVIDSHSGYYSLICFHPNLSITHLIKELEAKDILITDTKNSFFSPDHPLSHSIRMSFAKIEIKDITFVLETIYETAMKLIQKEL